MKKDKETYTTHTGHRLTIKEAKFIDEYIATGNARQSILKAGYKVNTPSQYADKLIKKDYIMDEINHRMEELKSEKIADAAEIMEYFSAVMRGEIKDQFGLEAPLGERTKAAQELAKRQIDNLNRGANKNGEAEVTIKLNWDRD